MLVRRIKADLIAAMDAEGLPSVSAFRPT